MCFKEEHGVYFLYRLGVMSVSMFLLFIALFECVI